jgi:DNA-directed RNA polymerase alpha subunit
MVDIKDEDWVRERSAALHEVYPALSAWADIPQFTQLGLSPRVRRPLWRCEVYTLRQLTSWSAAELLAITNFGPVALREVESLLRDHGLALKQPEPAQLPVDSRLAPMRQMRAAGTSLRIIGKTFGISAERVRQLLQN